MKTKQLLSAAVALGVLAGQVLAAGMMKPAGSMKSTTITGEVVDTACYIKMGAKGAGHKECAANCAKAGIPLGILDAKGNLYVAVSDKDIEPGNLKLMGHEAQQVTVTGKVFNKGGVRIVSVESVEAAK